MPNHFVTAVAGIVLGLILVGVVEAIRNSRRKQRDNIGDLLRRHFGDVSFDRIEVHAREFPYRVCVDAYQAVTEWLDANCEDTSVVGVPVTNSFMSSIGIASLWSQPDECSSETLLPTAIQFEAFDVGTESPANCVKHALWLANNRQHKVALLWTSETTHSGCGFQTMLKLEFAHLKGSEATADPFFRHIEVAIQQAVTYRGRTLSLEVSDDYRGHSGGIVVHRLRQVTRDEVILPESTVQLLERNIIRFVAQRRELTKLGLPVKKGLLFYGPPGTGKTHTIHYLVGALAGHTTLLVTAEQVGMLAEYVALARLLQPSVLVLEDVDLIGRDREHMEIGRESLLNRLLNEMDGLRPDAEVLFLLTTNRPESLERAIASRPGRIDQAIEFPLPDEAGRKKLIHLYAAGAAIDDAVVSHTARATHGVSASFIKELMRRAIQFHLECSTTDDEVRILQNDVDQAIDELLFKGGSLNRTLLGADGTAADEE